MSQGIFYILILIGFGIPSAGFFMSGSPIIGAFLALSGSVWVISERRNLLWGAPIALLIALSGSAYGSLTITGHPASIFNAISLLMAWNLAQFHRFIRQASPEDDLSIVEQRHLIKTMVFGLTALVISITSVYIQIRVTFIQAVVLLVLTIIGMMQLVGWILAKRESLE